MVQELSQCSRREETWQGDVGCYLEENRSTGAEVEGINERNALVPSIIGSGLDNSY